MQNNNCAVKHNELVLCKPEELEYPGGMVSEVQPMYKKALPTGVLPLITSPSGTRSISEPDKSFTETMVKAARLVGLSCLDHLVLHALNEEAVSIRGTFPYLFNH
ncbi:hypothetical protein IQ255_07770 [Pleurocapsales cyanobacterium LEGE 10410]|nr:hypothetical protein [Pleurocapsales cyanobacterium LEGE 10410]